MDAPSPHAAEFRRIGPSAALLGWVLGTALQLQQPELWPLGAYLLLAVAGALLGLWLWRYKSVRLNATQRRGLWSLALALLAFAAPGLRGVLFEAQALDAALEGSDVRVTGVVADLPQRNESGLRFTLAVESASRNGLAVRVPPRIDVGWYGTAGTLFGEPAGATAQPASLYAGQRWSLTLRLKAPHGSRNPQGFDYELWLWQRGVQASGYVRQGPTDVAPQMLGQTWAHPVALWRQQVRERIQATVAKRPVAGLLAALVVGDQAAIDRADWDVFRATGVAHLVSISGLHITLFAWGAAWLLARVWRRSARLCLLLPASTAALLGGVLLASGYALFSGWGIPAQRTCLMLATVALLRLLGVRWPWPQVWLLTCAVVLALDPWALLQAGFWLSFVAVGVLFASDAGLAHPVGNTLPGRAMGARLLALLREQWVVTLALAPLTLLLFGQVSLVGLLANAVAIPWVTLLLTPLALLGVLLPPLWLLASAAAGVLMGFLQWLAAWPWATLTLATAPWGLAAVGVLGGVLLVLRLPLSLRALGLPLLLPVLLWQAPVPPPGAFELLAADVGQGNAVLVRTANHALLYDAGPRYSQDSDAGHRVLLPLLQSLQVRLDTLLLIHRDTDHVGGAAAVLAMQPQAALLSSVALDDALQTLRLAHSAQRCAAGQHWEWDGVRFDILHPQGADYATPHASNTLSCVLRIQGAGVAAPVALLVGDIEAAQEATLVAAAAPLKADLLLVPHHGSKTSSSDAFLDAVQPRWGWVQSGYRNRYGHPALEVLQRYEKRGIVVHDSPHCGAMTWQSDKPEQAVCARTEEMHYWSHRVP